MQIKKCESCNVKIDHFEDFINLLNYDWNKDDFYSYFRNIGNIINNNI